VGKINWNWFSYSLYFFAVSRAFFSSPAAAVAMYCDEHVCLSVCLSVPQPTGYLRNHTRDLCQFFCACCLWPWFGPLPAGWRNPKTKRHFWGFSSPLTMHCNVFAAKWIGREVGDGSAQCGRSVIYDCLANHAMLARCTIWLCDRPSVRPTVTSRYCSQTVKRIDEKTFPQNKKTPKTLKKWQK